MTDPRIAEAIEVALLIEPILKGRHPVVQGAVLAQLLAKYIAGYQGEKAIREDMLQMHIDSVRRMVAAEIT